MGSRSYSKYPIREWKITGSVPPPIILFAAIQRVWLKEEIPNWLDQQEMLLNFKTQFNGGTTSGWKYLEDGSLQTTNGDTQYMWESMITTIGLRLYPTKASATNLGWMTFQKIRKRLEFLNGIFIPTVKVNPKSGLHMIIIPKRKFSFQ